MASPYGKMDGVTVTIRGKHNTGRTTIAILFQRFLEENGYSDVKCVDTQPLPVEEKPPFIERFTRNRERPVRIQVETEE